MTVLVESGKVMPNVCFRQVPDQVENGDYLYGAIHTPADLIENLRMKGIPLSIFEMDVNHYEAFLRERRKLMAEKIKEYYQEL